MKSFAGPERERYLLINEYKYSTSLWAILFFPQDLEMYSPYHLQLKCYLIVVNNCKTELLLTLYVAAMEKNSQGRTKNTVSMLFNKILND